MSENPIGAKRLQDMTIADAIAASLVSAKWVAENGYLWEGRVLQGGDIERVVSERWDAINARGEVK